MHDGEDDIRDATAVDMERGNIDATLMPQDAVQGMHGLACGASDYLLVERGIPARRGRFLPACATSACMLSWLFDTLDRAMGLPPMQNSDGDNLMFHDVRFPLVTGVTQRDIATRVNAIPAMAQENAKFWNGLEDKPRGRRKVKQADAFSFDATMDNGQRVLGNVELEERFLHLSTNSTTRAEKRIMLTRQALGD